MRVLDLFSGIGGFSLGLERAGMHTDAISSTTAYSAVSSSPASRMALRSDGLWGRTPIPGVSLRADAILSAERQGRTSALAALVDSKSASTRLTR